MEPFIFTIKPMEDDLFATVFYNGKYLCNICKEGLESILPETADLPEFEVSVKFVKEGNLYVARDMGILDHTFIYTKRPRWSQLTSAFFSPLSSVRLLNDLFNLEPGEIRALKIRRIS